MASGEAAQPLVALLGADAVSLLSLKSRQAVGSLRGSRGASCAAFSADGQMLHTAGESPASEVLGHQGLQANECSAQGCLMLHTAGVVLAGGAANL